MERPARGGGMPPGGKASRQSRTALHMRLFISRASLLQPALCLIVAWGFESQATIGVYPRSSEASLPPLRCWKLEVVR